MGVENVANKSRSIGDDKLSNGDGSERLKVAKSPSSWSDSDIVTDEISDISFRKNVSDVDADEEMSVNDINEESPEENIREDKSSDSKHDTSEYSKYIRSLQKK